MHDVLDDDAVRFGGCVGSGFERRSAFVHDVLDDDAVRFGGFSRCFCLFFCFIGLDGFFCFFQHFRCLVGHQACHGFGFAQGAFALIGCLVYGIFHFFKCLACFCRHFAGHCFGLFEGFLTFISGFVDGGFGLVGKHAGHHFGLVQGLFAFISGLFKGFFGLVGCFVEGFFRFVGHHAGNRFCGIDGIYQHVAQQGRGSFKKAVFFCWGSLLGLGFDLCSDFRLHGLLCSGNFLFFLYFLDSFGLPVFGGICLLFNVQYGAAHVFELFPLRNNALFDHLYLCGADLGFQLAFGAVHFFVLEFKLFLVAEDALFHALYRCAQSAQPAVVPVCNRAFVRFRAKFPLFCLFKRFVDTVPDLVAVFVAHARIAVSALHLFELFEHAAELRAAGSDARINIVERLIEVAGNTRRSLYELFLHFFAHCLKLFEKQVDVVAQMVGMLTEQVALARLALYFVPERFQAVPKLVVISAELRHFFFEFFQFLLIHLVQLGR